MAVAPNQISSIADLDKIIQEKSRPQEPSAFKYILLSVAFPPSGLYLAWKKKILPYVLPLFTSFYSIIFLLFSIQTNSSLTSIQQLTGDFVEKPNPANYSFQILNAALIIFGVVGIISGIYFRFKVRRETKLSNKIMLFLFLIFLGELVLSILISYSLTSQIYSELDTMQKILE